MVKDDPRYEIDVDVPSAGFVVAVEVLDHEKDVKFSTCGCVIELTIGKMMEVMSIQWWS